MQSVDLSKVNPDNIFLFDSAHVVLGVSKLPWVLQGYYKREPPSKAYREGRWLLLETPPSVTPDVPFISVSAPWAPEGVRVLREAARKCNLAGR